MLQQISMQVTVVQTTTAFLTRGKRVFSALKLAISGSILKKLVDQKKPLLLRGVKSPGQSRSSPLASCCADKKLTEQSKCHNVKEHRSVTLTSPRRLLCPPDKIKRQYRSIAYSHSASAQTNSVNQKNPCPYENKQPEV